MTTETHGRIIYKYDDRRRIVAVDHPTARSRHWCVEHDAPAREPDICRELDRRLDRRVAAIYTGGPVDWSDEYGDCQIVPNVTLR